MSFLSPHNYASCLVHVYRNARLSIDGIDKAGASFAIQLITLVCLAVDLARQSLC